MIDITAVYSIAYSMDSTKRPVNSTQISNGYLASEEISISFFSSSTITTATCPTPIVSDLELHSISPVTQ